MSPEKLTAVLELIAIGEPSGKACRSVKAATSDFWRAVAADDTVRERYLRARDSGLERWADEIVDLADESRLGKKREQGMGANGPIDKTVTADMVERTRLQIESRKWLLAKLRPKKYGDAMQITGAGGGALQINVTQKDVDVV